MLNREVQEVECGKRKMKRNTKCIRKNTGKRKERNKKMNSNQPNLTEKQEAWVYGENEEEMTEEDYEDYFHKPLED